MSLVNKHLINITIQYIDYSIIYREELLNKTQNLRINSCIEWVYENKSIISRDYFNYIKGTMIDGSYKYQNYRHSWSWEIK
jgi:hypothetical protein